jgi:flotillin
MNMDPAVVTFIFLPASIFFAMLVFVTKQYKRCPSNKILVVFGKVSGGNASKCVHGGGVLVIPLIQDYAYLHLEPMTIDIELTGALSKKNIRVNVPSTFTVGISTQPEIMQNAAERLLGLGENEIKTQARDIILGQLRLVIATLSIEEINQDREKFLDLIGKNVNTELTKIGLEVINVNIRDITDESGYIAAIGKKAAAEAINKAKVEVAEADREGAIGESNANRHKDVEVANQMAQAEIGRKQAERDQRITISKLEAEGASGEAIANREREVVVAQEMAKAAQAKKEAEREQRIYLATKEAEAIKGENMSKAAIAEYNAELKQKEALVKRTADIAQAEAQRDILRAEKEREVALLEKETLAKQEVEKKRLEVEAETQAETLRRTAKGEADAIFLKYEAEALGIKKVLEAKADGYRMLMDSCGKNSVLAPTFLLVEQLPQLIEKQVQAIQNLKIDKITVWDSGSGDKSGGSATSNFMRSLIGSVPALHDLAKQVGVELPEYLGSISTQGISAMDKQIEKELIEKNIMPDNNT